MCPKMAQNGQKYPREHWNVSHQLPHEKKTPMLREVSYKKDMSGKISIIFQKWKMPQKGKLETIFGLKRVLKLRTARVQSVWDIYQNMPGSSCGSWNWSRWNAYVTLYGFALPPPYREAIANFSSYGWQFTSCIPGSANRLPLACNVTASRL